MSIKKPALLILGIASVFSITQCGGSSTSDVKTATQATRQPEVAEIPSPANPGSGEPNLTTGPDGRVYLSWLDAEGDTTSMKFSVMNTNGTWSPATVVASGDHWFVNAADYPSLLVLPDGTLAAHWLADNAPGTEAYNVRVSFSHDKGATWTTPVIPHHDRSENEHGFVSLVAAGPSEIGALWLDGHQIKDEEGDMALIYTTIRADGTVGKEATIDSRVCECCQTSAVMTSEGIVAVYRDRSADEIRDISIVRSTAEGWTKPTPLSRDNWEIEGCPVNGPSISVAGTTAAVAWFTAPHSDLRVNVALSSDSGKTFGPPIRVADGKPIGRVDVAALPAGGALVSWVEQADGGAQVRVRRVQPDGGLGDAIVVSGKSGATTGGVPQLAIRDDAAVVAWTDKENPARIHTASVRLN